MARRLSPRFRRVFGLALVAALAATLLLATGASADLITPQDGPSPNANRIDSLYKLILGMAVVVFLGVEGTLLWSLVKYRAKKGRVAAQIHGNTRLEIGWTVGAALILIFLTVVTFIELEGIKNPDPSGPNGLAAAGGGVLAATDQKAPPGGDALHIRVNGQQYVWRYQYPEEDVFAYDEMVVPTDTTVVLDITSDDVVHSWWIPKLGGKMDAVPGYINKTWFKAIEPGAFPGQCAELCGRNHANMLATVRAVPVPEYKAWVEQRKRDIAAAQSGARDTRELLERRMPGDEAAEGGPAGGAGNQDSE